MLFVEYSVNINRCTPISATPYVFVIFFWIYTRQFLNSYWKQFHSVLFNLSVILTSLDHRKGGKSTFTFSFFSAAASSISASSISRFLCSSALYRAFCFLVLSFLGLSPVLSYSRSLNCSALAKYRLQSNLNILIPGIWINWNI